MYNHVLFFYYWLTNSLLLFVFNFIFPNDMVLGNWRFSALEAVAYTGFWVTFMVWLFWDWALARNFRLDLPLFRFGYFWLVNTFAFWAVSRLAHYFGFGISDYYWAISIALPAYLIQQFVREKLLAKNRG